jgi:hypothetical protein
LFEVGKFAKKPYFRGFAVVPKEPHPMAIADGADFSNAQLAYVFATVEHESQFTPIYEKGPRNYFNQYEPGTKKGRVLGNTEKGDGYTFRGAGYVQLTGRANFAKYGIENTPAMALDSELAAVVAIDGMENGVFTGKKLSTYINDKKTDFRNARRVINRLDKAKLAASYAPKYLDALKDCGRANSGPRQASNRGRM